MRSGTLRLLPFIIILFSCDSSWAQNQNRLPLSGALTVSANSPQGKAVVTITTATLENQCAKACPTTNRWIEDVGENTASVVQKMEISVRGKTVGVPISVYASLLEPSTATLKFDKGSFILEIHGADGGEAYFALIYFNASEISQLKLYASEFPAHPTQITRYYP
jgi:hypothetical protein